MNSNKLFRVSAIDGVLIVELIGVVSSLADVSITQQLTLVREQLRNGACDNVVIDLGQVAYFGSSMLEAIRTLWIEVSPRNGRLVLCNASEVAREILQIAKFDHLWPLVATRADAQALLQA